jgi:hypothetical protein
MTRKIPARLKLPVHWVDGHWEFALGGAVPVRAGAGAELVIASSQISDVDFLKRVTQEVAVQFLPEGTDLLVALTPRSPDGQRMLGVPTLDHVRALAADSGKVFITEHARDRMLERGISDLEVIDCLRHGVIQRPSQMDRKTGHLKCRMEHFGPSRNVAVVAALDEANPDVVVVTVMTRTR